MSSPQTIRKNLFVTVGVLRREWPLVNLPNTARSDFVQGYDFSSV